MNSVSELPCEHLLHLARQGCNRSLGELLDRYRKYLKALVRVQLHRSLEVKADASDLVQETFLRAPRRVPAVSGRERAATTRLAPCHPGFPFGQTCAAAHDAASVADVGAAAGGRTGAFLDGFCPGTGSPGSHSE